MKVLVVGSLDHIAKDEAKTEKFKEACRELGRVLAGKRGVDFVVGSMGETTADRYILEGISRVEGEHKVFYFRPEGKSMTDISEAKKGPGNFDPILRYVRGSWAEGTVPQVGEADAVILIGGGRRTRKAGYAAMALEKPVLALGHFDGTASDLWNEFDPFYQKLGNLYDKVVLLRERWKKGDADLVVRTLKELGRTNAFRRTNQPLSWVVIGVVVRTILLMSWVWLFVAPPRLLPLQAAFFILLGVSALLGTSLRSSLLGVLDPTATRSRKALVAEINAGLLLAFALALLYLGGSVTFTGKYQTISSLSDYQRVAIVAGLSGIAGGWLIERVAETLTRWFSARLSNSE